MYLFFSSEPAAAAAAAASCWNVPHRRCGCASCCCLRWQPPMRNAVDADLTLAIALNSTEAAPGGTTDTKGGAKHSRPITWRTLRDEGGDVLEQCR